MPIEPPGLHHAQGAPGSDADRVGAAVRKMDGWLRKRYTGAYGR